MLRIYTHVADRLSLRATTSTEALSPAVWYDLTNPTPAEDAEVEALLGVDIPTRDEMEDIELSARLYQENGAEFMTMTALASLDSEEATKTPVTFIMKGSTLVTVRYADPKPKELTF